MSAASHLPASGSALAPLGWSIHSVGSESNGVPCTPLLTPPWPCVWGPCLGLGSQVLGPGSWVLLFLPIAPSLLLVRPCCPF